MSSMVFSLEDRMTRLEGAVTPLQSSTNGLDVVCRNIQSSLNAIDSDQRLSTITSDDEQAIIAGADSNDIRPYLKLVCSLCNQLKHLKHSQWSSSKNAATDLKNHVQSGTQSLLRVFQGWVRDVSIPIDADSWNLLDFPGIPQHAVARLSAFIDAVYPILDQLDDSAYTHPSIIYSSERARYLNISLQPIYKKSQFSLDAHSKSGPLGTPLYLKGSQSLSSLIKTAIAMADVEWLSVVALFGRCVDDTGDKKETHPSDYSSHSIHSPFTSAIAPAATLIHSATSNIFSLARSTPLKHIFPVLDVIEGVTPLAEPWDKAVTARCTQPSTNQVAALVEECRSIALHSFSDVIKRVRLHNEEKHMTDVSVVTNDTIAYLKEIPAYSNTMEQLLRRVEWGGRSEQRAPRANLLENYLRDVLTNLITTLTHLKPNAYTTIYTLNNLSVLRRELIEACEPVSLDPSKADSPSNRDIGDLLGEAAEDALNDALRTWRMAYLDAVWKPSQVALTSDELSTTNQGPHVPTALGGSAERKQLIKDKFSRFNEAFSHLESLHTKHPVAKRDKTLLGRLGKECKAMLLPPYATLWGKNQSGDFAKTPSKYMRITPDQLEARIDGFNFNHQTKYTSQKPEDGSTRIMGCEWQNGVNVPLNWLQLLRPAACSHSLSRMSVDAFVANNRGHRGLRVGVDASIWLIHSQTAPGGLNPALRTLFFKLSKLMTLPILPLFVFDGPGRPKMKRGKQVRGRQPRGLKDFIKLIDAFGFEHHQAPGEAEAELAHLSKMATIDVILSDDVDSLLFGGVKILRNWSLTLSGNSSRSQLQLQADGQTRTHDSLAADDHRVETYTLSDVHSHPSTAVTPAGLILVALLAGGDYHPAGVQNCGTKNAFGLARAGFGEKLMEGVSLTPPSELPSFLDAWRAEMREELTHNTSGHLSSKRPAVAAALTPSFPDMEVLARYTHPLTTASTECDAVYRASLAAVRFAKEPDIAALARFCEEYFEWGERSRIVAKFRSSVWDGVYVRALRAATCALDSGECGEFNEEAKSHLVRIHQTRNKSNAERYVEYRISVDPAPYVRIVEMALTGDMRALREARKRNDPALRDLRNALPDENGGNSLGTDVSSSNLDLTADPTPSQTQTQTPSQSLNTQKSKPPTDQHAPLRMWVPSQILRAALRNETDAFDSGRGVHSSGSERVATVAPSRIPHPASALLREKTIVDEQDKQDEQGDGNGGGDNSDITTRYRSVRGSRGGRGRGGGRSRRATANDFTTNTHNTLTRHATIEDQPDYTQANNFDFVDFTDSNNPIVLPSPPKVSRKRATKGGVNVASTEGYVGNRASTQRTQQTQHTQRTPRKTSGSKRHVDSTSTDNLGERLKRIGAVGEGAQDTAAPEDLNAREELRDSEDAAYSGYSGYSGHPQHHRHSPPSCSKTPSKPKQYSLASPLDASLSPPSPSALFGLGGMGGNEKEKEKEKGEFGEYALRHRHKPKNKNKEPIQIDDSPVNTNNTQDLDGERAKTTRTHASHSPINISSDESSTPRGKSTSVVKGSRSRSKKRDSLSPSLRRRSEGSKRKNKTLTGVFAGRKPVHTPASTSAHKQLNSKTNDVIDLT
ncbi:hypothetical protein E3P77_02756 [Wallemia ichthyophaga]|nr:hypothetical protein E3P77_02756 [Wallemia ichthyophaga]